MWSEREGRRRKGGHMGYFLVTCQSYFSHSKSTNYLAQVKCIITVPRYYNGNTELFVLNLVFNNYLKAFIWMNREPLSIIQCVSAAGAVCYHQFIKDNDNILVKKNWISNCHLSVVTFVNNIIWPPQKTNIENPKIIHKQRDTNFNSGLSSNLCPPCYIHKLATPKTGRFRKNNKGIPDKTMVLCSTCNASIKYTRGNKFPSYKKKLRLLQWSQLEASNSARVSNNFMSTLADNYSKAIRTCACIV